MPSSIEKLVRASIIEASHIEKMREKIGKFYSLLFLVFFISNVFSFDIRKPSSIDCFSGYGKGHLDRQPDYKFSIVSVDFSYPVSSVWDFQLEPFTSYVFNPEDNFEES